MTDDTLDPMPELLKRHTPAQQLALDERTYAAYTGEQLDAICGDIPMTQELFESILHVCLDTDNLNECFEVLHDYPRHKQVLWEKLTGSKEIRLDNEKGNR